jgi:hypothetical protein
MLNFIKIRWEIAEILGSKILAETACKVHSRWIFPAKLLSRCKPAPPFLVISILSCFIRDRAIESDLTSLILNVSLTWEIKSQIFLIKFYSWVILPWRKVKVKRHLHKV